MKLEPVVIKTIIAQFFRQCETARAAGGIRACDVYLEGAKVPKDWVLDFNTQYFLPPNIKLF